MTADRTIISRVRRDLALATVLQAVMLGAAMAGIFWGNTGLLVAVGVGALWLMLGLFSVQGSRLAAESPHLITTGQYEQAERQIEQSLRRFSLLRTVKLMGVHHLAVLRHAQHRWPEAAMLSRALLGQRLGAAGQLRRPSRLILAESLLELGDLAGAYEALASLYQERLSLGESLKLLHVQLEYSARVGDWAGMLRGIGAKIQMIELMPARSAARAQAFLALAAKRMGQAELCRWLTDRVELLADVQSLAAERRILWELWQQAS